jgi:NitT/TauT family transport system permease protein
MTSNIIEQLKLLPQRLFAVVLFLIIWEVASNTGLANPFFVPSASTTFIRLGELLSSGILLNQVYISLQRSSVGFVVAIITGIPLGFMIGWFGIFEKYMDPLFQSFRQVPILALFPVFILLFGIGEISKIAIIALSSFWPIFMNTASGVKTVDPMFIKLARSLCISHSNMLKKIILPATIPSIFTGIRLSGTVSMLMLVIAEMLGGESGIGFFVFNAQQRHAYRDFFAGILAISIIGIVVNYGLILIQMRMTSWKEDIYQN